MKNFNIILIHELQTQLKNYKFLLIIIFSLVVGILSTYVQIDDYINRSVNLNNEIIKANEEAGNATVFSEFKVTIFQPLNPLSVFVKGFEEKAGNKAIISIEELPEFKTVSQKINPFTAIFTTYDISTIVKIVLSLLIIFLVSDTISKERDEKTLGLIFANEVNKLEYFLAKFSGNLLIAIIPILILFLVPLVIIALSSSIAMSGSQYLRAGLIFLNCIIYISIFVIFGIIVSVKTNTTSLAIISSLIIWIMIVIVYPNLVNYLVSKNVDIPDSEVIMSEISTIDTDWESQLNEYQKKNWPTGSFSAMYMKNGISGLPNRIGLSSETHFNYYENVIKELMPVYNNVIQQKIKIYDNYRTELQYQRTIAGKFQIILPGYLFENGSTTLAGTDYNSIIAEPLIQIRDYRNTLLKYLEGKNAYGLKYFTIIEKKDMKNNFSEYSNYEKYTLANPKNWAKLNLQDAPAFSWNYSIKFPVEIFALIVEILVLLLIAFYTFSRTIKII